MSKLIGKTYTATLATKVTSFTSSGTFTADPSSGLVDYLVVAGGGGSANSGGGAGGYREVIDSSFPVTGGSTYPVVIGAGGAAGAPGVETDAGVGSPSSIGSYVDSYTTLLIHSDTSDGSTTFTDSSNSSHSITVAGNTHHETDQKKIGDTSIYFDGTGDYLEIADHTDLDLDGGDFTIECWFRCDDVSSPTLQSILSKWQPDSYTSYYLLIHPTDQLRWYVGNGDGVIVIEYLGSTTISDNTWYHAALTKVGDVFTAYVNGTQAGSTLTFAAFADTSKPVRIGSASSPNERPFKGYVDEVRISKGIARYTQNFTAPTLIHDRVIATGGGIGGRLGQAGGDGGSGGGANTGSGGSGNTPPTSPPQGNDGADGGSFGSGADGSGCGGGGMGEAGHQTIIESFNQPYSAQVQEWVFNKLGNGGIGKVSSITGSNVYYAGGGGGGGNNQNNTDYAGGNGGGGAGATSGPGTGTVGTANTGGGAGGGGSASGGIRGNGATGGSGIVIIGEPQAGTWSAGGVWDLKQAYKKNLEGKWR